MAKYECTDCGKPMSHPGTCNDCLVNNQPPPKKLLKAIGKKGK